MALWWHGPQGKPLARSARPAVVTRWAVSKNGLEVNEARESASRVCARFWRAVAIRVAVGPHRGLPLFSQEGPRQPTATVSSIPRAQARPGKAAALQGRRISGPIPNKVLDKSGTRLRACAGSRSEFRFRYLEATDGFFDPHGKRMAVHARGRSRPAATLRQAAPTGPGGTSTPLVDAVRLSGLPAERPDGRRVD